MARYVIPPIEVGAQPSGADVDGYLADMAARTTRIGVDQIDQDSKFDLEMFSHRYATDVRTVSGIDDWGQAISTDHAGAAGRLTFIARHDGTFERADGYNLNIGAEDTPGCVVAVAGIDVTVAGGPISKDDEVVITPSDGRIACATFLWRLAG